MANISTTKTNSSLWISFSNIVKQVAISSGSEPKPEADYQPRNTEPPYERRKEHKPFP